MVGEREGDLFKRMNQETMKNREKRVGDKLIVKDRENRVRDKNARTSHRFGCQSSH